MPLPAPEVVAGPTARLLDTSLLLGPLAYLAADCSYAARGWNDGPTAAMHIVAAAIYGLTAVKLVSLTRGRTQALLLVVALLGIVGNAGVGENTLHIALGGTTSSTRTARPTSSRRWACSSRSPSCSPRSRSGTVGRGSPSPTPW